MSQNESAPPNVGASTDSPDTAPQRDDATPLVSVQFASQRVFRNMMALGALLTYKETPSKFAKTLPGSYGTQKHNDLIRLDATGDVVISKDAYVDDVVAFCFGVIQSNATIDASIKQHLANFVNDMDARAVARHGYSADEAEAAVVWIPATVSKRLEA